MSAGAYNEVRPSVTPQPFCRQSWAPKRRRIASATRLPMGVSCLPSSVRDHGKRAVAVATGRAYRRSTEKSAVLPGTPTAASLGVIRIRTRGLTGPAVDAALFSQVFQRNVCGVPAGEDVSPVKVEVDESGLATAQVLPPSLENSRRIVTESLSGSARV